MKCPVCKSTQLSRTDYHGVPVKTCQICKGYLVKKGRVQRITNTPPKSDEPTTPPINFTDTIRLLNCPACARGMDKKTIPLGRQRFFVDQCEHCKLIWYDAHELVRLQDRKEQPQNRIYLLQHIESLKRGRHSENVLILWIHYPCPNCEKGLSSRATGIGSSINCRHCSHGHVVPEVPVKKN